MPKSEGIRRVVVSNWDGDDAHVGPNGSIATKRLRLPIDFCEDITGVTGSVDVSGIALSTVHRGPRQYSIEFDKNGVTQAYGQIERTVVAIDGEHWAAEAYVHYYLYLTAGDLATITAAYFAIGTDDTNYWYWETPVAALAAGWNYISHRLDVIDGEVGDGAHMNNITWWALRVTVAAIGNTLTNTRLDDVRLERVDSVAISADYGIGCELSPYGGERQVCAAASQAATVPAGAVAAEMTAENGDIRFNIDAAAAANSSGFVPVWDTRRIGLTGITSLATFGAVGSFVNIRYFRR